MFNSLKKSFEAYKKHPFIFVWGSLVYLLMLVVFTLAAVGLFLIYFMISALTNTPVGPEEPITLAVVGVTVLILAYFLSGLSAGLSMTYQKALTTSKTSLAEFYGYALQKAPVVFEILLIRDLLSLLIIGPAVAVYFYFLENMQYMDWVLGIYVLFWIFVLHFLFTPAFISAGAFNKGLYASMRQAFRLIRKKHANYLGLFILFALFWLLNFVPLVQLVTLFFLYPVAYAAIVSMMENYNVQ